MTYPDYCYFRSGKLRSTVALRLSELLENISKDPEFIFGVLNDLKTDEDNQKVIDYIKNGEDVTFESVILYALDINLQNKSESKSHNADDNSQHNVFIISGAPASGKTTYVQSKRKQGDLVFDLDAICAALGGTSELYEDHKPYLDTALRVRDVIYEQIEKRTGKWHDAYVITASNDSKFVEALAERLNGTVIAMKATREQCIEQAKKDERRQAYLDKQIEIINEWFDTRS